MTNMTNKETNENAVVPPLTGNVLREREHGKIGAFRFVGRSITWFNLYRREIWPSLFITCLPSYSPISPE